MSSPADGTTSDTSVSRISSSLSPELKEPVMAFNEDSFIWSVRARYNVTYFTGRERGKLYRDAIETIGGQLVLCQHFIVWGYVSTRDLCVFM